MRTKWKYYFDAEVPSFLNLLLPLVLPRALSVLLNVTLCKVHHGGRHGIVHFYKVFRRFAQGITRIRNPPPPFDFGGPDPAPSRPGPAQPKGKS